MEGQEAINDMMCNKLIDLNPYNAARLKDLKEEEITGKPSLPIQELPSQELNLELRSSFGN